MSRPKKPSPTQLAALRYYASKPEARRGLAVPSDVTRASLIRAGWLRYDDTLSDAGQAFMPDVVGTTRCGRAGAESTGDKQLGLDELLLRRRA